MKPSARQSARLTLKNPTYRKFTSELLELIYRADIGAGDNTTTLLKNPHAKVKAIVKAKQTGVLAGLDEAEYFWGKHKVKITKRKRDGAQIKRGEIVARLTGSALNILTTERTALNLIQRLSGIATATADVVKQVGKNKIAATRKTPLGLLDCRAVVLGGGLSHRLSLSDQILVKDNHLALDPTCWQQIATREPFEIETNTTKLATKIAKYFQDSKNLILLLDNFTPAKLQKLIPKLRAINPKILLEASGNITTKNAKHYLKTGADYVSLGALTHSSPALDFSLKIAN